MGKILGGIFLAIAAVLLVENFTEIIPLEPMIVDLIAIISIGVAGVIFWRQY